MMTPQEQVKQITDKLVANLCHITEYPESWLPHSVWVEEESTVNGDPTYVHYMLEKIRPDGTCDLHHPDTGELEHDDCHLSEINIDWLVTIWNRYIELCNEQNIWKDRAVEILQEQIGVVIPESITTFPKCEACHSWIQYFKSLNIFEFYCPYCGCKISRQETTSL